MCDHLPFFLFAPNLLVIIKMEHIWESLVSIVSNPAGAAIKPRYWWGEGRSCGGLTSYCLNSAGHRTALNCIALHCTYW